MFENDKSNTRRQMSNLSGESDRRTHSISCIFRCSLKLGQSVLSSPLSTTSCCSLVLSRPSHKHLPLPFSLCRLVLTPPPDSHHGPLSGFLASCLSPTPSPLAFLTPTSDHVPPTLPKTCTYLNMSVTLLWDLMSPYFSSLGFCLSLHPPTPATQNVLCPLLASASQQNQTSGPPR